MNPRTQRKRNVLPFKRDFDPKDLTKLKHSITRTVNDETDKTTLEVPKLRVDATQTEFLNFIIEFSDARTTMGWTTGPKLFSKFVVHLEGDDKTVWSELSLGINQTVVNFDSTLKEFIESKFLPDDYHIQKKYLTKDRILFPPQ